MIVYNNKSNARRFTISQLAGSVLSSGGRFRVPWRFWGDGFWAAGTVLGKRGYCFNISYFKTSVLDEYSCLFSLFLEGSNLHVASLCMSDRIRSRIALVCLCIPVVSVNITANIRQTFSISDTLRYMLMLI